MNKESVKRIDVLEEFLRESRSSSTKELVHEKMFYSYRHANRLFKSLKGESIQSFSNKMRLQASAEFLKYSTIPIADIAIMVGYESTASFSKAFKKQYQNGPTAFRENSRSYHLVAVSYTHLTLPTTSRV